MESSTSVRGAQTPILLKQVLNDGLLLPIDPAGDKKNDEGEWRRQRVHRASVPESVGPCKRRRIRNRAAIHLGDFRRYNPPADGGMHR